ncbi:MAG: DUF434 domain-containing protein [Pirellulales bacterium]
MPDDRQHRGPQTDDLRLFAGDQVPALRQATSDLCWLLTRGYAIDSSLKLVGDRYRLVARQRLAVLRSAAGERAVAGRASRLVRPGDLAGTTLWIDGFNVITSVEAALSGGVILGARDGTYRDLASVHGTYRKVTETMPALGAIGRWLSRHELAECVWWLDAPVSNSGRLKELILSTAGDHGWSWRAEVVPNPDAVLSASDAVVASADSQILDRARRWCNLARNVIDAEVPNCWLIDLSGPHRA